MSTENLLAQGVLQNQLKQEVYGPARAMEFALVTATSKSCMDGLKGHLLCTFPQVWATKLGQAQKSPT